MDDKVEYLIRFYEEHATQARQHETLRSNMSNLMMVISGAIIAVISAAKFDLYTLPLSMFLIFFGYYGRNFSRKHYGKNRFHNAVMFEIRKEIEKHPNIKSPKLTYNIKKRAKWDNKSDPELSLHEFWERLLISISIIGIGFFVISLLVNLLPLISESCSQT